MESRRKLNAEDFPTLGEAGLQSKRRPVSVPLASRAPNPRRPQPGQGAPSFMPSTVSDDPLTATHSALHVPQHDDSISIHRPYWRFINWGKVQPRSRLLPGTVISTPVHTPLAYTGTPFTTTVTSYGYSYTKLRKLVIISISTHHCVALRIATFNNTGLTGKRPKDNYCSLRDVEIDTKDHYQQEGPNPIIYMRRNADVKVDSGRPSRNEVS